MTVQLGFTQSKTPEVRQEYRHLQLLAQTSGCWNALDVDGKIIDFR